MHRPRSAEGKGRAYGATEAKLRSWSRGDVHECVVSCPHEPAQLGVALLGNAGRCIHRSLLPARRCNLNRRVEFSWKTCCWLKDVKGPAGSQGVKYGRCLTPELWR